MCLVVTRPSLHVPASPVTGRHPLLDRVLPKSWIAHGRDAFQRSLVARASVPYPLLRHVAEREDAPLRRAAHYTIRFAVLIEHVAV